MDFSTEEKVQKREREITSRLVVILCNKCTINLEIIKTTSRGKELQQATGSYPKEVCYLLSPSLRKFFAVAGKYFRCKTDFSYL